MRSGDFLQEGGKGQSIEVGLFSSLIKCSIIKKCGRKKLPRRPVDKGGFTDDPTVVMRNWKSQKYFSFRTSSSFIEKILLMMEKVSNKRVLHIPTHSPNRDEPYGLCNLILGSVGGRWWNNYFHISLKVVKNIRNSLQEAFYWIYFINIFYSSRFSFSNRKNITRHSGKTRDEGVEMINDESPFVCNLFHFALF